MHMQQGRDASASPCWEKQEEDGSSCIGGVEKNEKEFFLRQICFRYTEKEIQGNKAGC